MILSVVETLRYTVRVLPTHRELYKGNHPNWLPFRFRCSFANRRVTLKLKMTQTADSIHDIHVYSRNTDAMPTKIQWSQSAKQFWCFIVFLCKYTKKRTLWFCRKARKILLFLFSWKMADHLEMLNKFFSPVLLIQFAKKQPEKLSVHI